MISSEADRKAWQPYVEAVTSLCSMGETAEYYVMNPERKYSNRSKLRSMFQKDDVENAEDMKESMEWSISTGIRTEFEQLRNELWNLSEEDRVKRIERCTELTEQHKLRVVNSYLRRLPPGGVGAYDFTWGIFKALAGKKIGYLQEDEAWEYISRIIPLIKQNYSDWYEYTIGFAVGYNYLLSGLSSDYVSSHRQHIMRMFTVPNSPFRQVKI